MTSTSAVARVVPPFLVTLAGLGLVSVTITAISPSRPGVYTSGWLLSPFIGIAGIAVVGYVAGRVAEKTWVGFGAVVAGVVAFVTGLAVVYAPDWAGGPALATLYAYGFVGPLVLALMVPTYALARHQAARQISARQRQATKLANRVSVEGPMVDGVQTYVWQDAEPEPDNFGKPWG